MPIESNLKGESREWVFDSEVSDHFDEMLERSIPGYESMRALTVELADPFLIRGGDKTASVLDLGTSTGAVLWSLWNRYGAGVRYTGYEVSEPMLDAARARFVALTDYVSIENRDLRDGWPHAPHDAIFSVLTLQFTPIEYRPTIVRNAYDSLRTGGAFFVVEKLIGGTASSDALLRDRYRELKHKNGYSYDEIDRKAIALEGVLVPVTDGWNRELLHGAGFHTVECYWRTLNFAGYVAIRD